MFNSFDIKSSFVVYCIYISAQFMNTYTHLSIYLFIYLYIYLSIYLSIYLQVHNVQCTCTRYGNYGDCGKLVYQLILPLNGQFPDIYSHIISVIKDIYSHIISVIKVIMQEKLFQSCAQLLYCSVLMIKIRFFSAPSVTHKAECRNVRVHVPNLILLIYLGFLGSMQNVYI